MSSPEDPFRKPGSAEGPEPAADQGQPPRGYQPPGYGPSAYGSPGYGPAAYGSYGPPPPETSSRAIVALVLAVLSFTVFPLVPAVAALVVSRDARREIDQSGGRLTGVGLVQGAQITAWINIGLCVALLVLLVGLLAFVALASV